MDLVIHEASPLLINPAADALVRAALGPLTTGVSLKRKRGQPSVLTVHLLDSATGQDVQKAQTLFALYGVMTVTVSKAAIVADDEDVAVLTCNDARINSDAKVDYRVWTGTGVLYASGTVDVVAGSVALEFGTPTPGKYLIEIARRKGNFATAATVIEAVE